MKFDEHPSVDAITMLTCDVTDEVPVKNRVTEVLKQAGCIDLLVNNAGSGVVDSVLNPPCICNMLANLIYKT